MKIDYSYIRLDHLRFHAYHGALAQERTVGNDYELSLRVKYSVAKAMATDNVADTINYATLYRIAANEMRSPSNLLEHVAGRIAQTIAAEFPDIEAIDITLTKLNPPMGTNGGSASIEVHLNNDKTIR